MQLLNGGSEMILQRWGLIRTISKTTEQLRQSLLQTHAMNQSILLLFQPLLLSGILQTGSLKLLKQGLLISPLILETLLFPLNRLKGRC